MPPAGYVKVDDKGRCGREDEGAAGQRLRGLHGRAGRSVEPLQAASRAGAGRQAWCSLRPAIGWRLPIGGTTLAPRRSRRDAVHRTDRQQRGTPRTRQGAPRHHPSTHGEYADLPMDLADASLVVAATELGDGRILTTDQRDFNAYCWKAGRTPSPSQLAGTLTAGRGTPASGVHLGRGVRDIAVGSALPLRSRSSGHQPARSHTRRCRPTGGLLLIPLCRNRGEFLETGANEILVDGRCDRCRFSLG